VKDLNNNLKLKPDFKFLLSNPVYLLSFGFGSGLAKKAPGTFGTIVGLPMYLLLEPHLNLFMMLALITVLFAIGIWFCDKTGEALGVNDYKGIVWDEIVAMMLVMTCTPPGYVWAIVAFAAFRFFDIFKPFPISFFDKNYHNGFGVMFDDILAAGYAILVLEVFKINFIGHW
jgi:phosphatidylglycerophosphatase A